MNLYLISQAVNDDYDTFDSAVVVAPNTETARGMYPGDPDGKLRSFQCGDGTWEKEKVDRTWAFPQDVYVMYLGVADLIYTEQKVICSSFNAG